jgi:hypothetical protein
VLVKKEMKTAIALMFPLAAAIVALSPTMTAAAQTSSSSMGDDDNINTASSFLDRLREIMDICAEQAQSDVTLSLACTNIINDFNNHMTELFDEEQNDIGQVMLGGNQ